MKKKKLLNLFAGIGGNRTLWSDEYEITAIEIDSRLAFIYHIRFPNDEVIVTDAIPYLENHFHEYSVIWVSPECKTHSHLTCMRAQNKYNGTFKGPIRIPDISSLYGVILHLQNHFKGEWIVENVKPFYKPLIPPTSKIGRHYIWSSRPIPPMKRKKGVFLKDRDEKSKAYEIKGVEFNLSPYFTDREENQILNNCVRPEEGKWILDHLVGKKTQTKLSSYLMEKSETNEKNDD